MITIMLIVSCLAASYFFVFLLIANHWGQALVYGIYGSLVFSLGLLAASFVSPAMSWRAFWIANIGLILIFGGIELYSLLTLENSNATRFGGARLSIDGRITPAGLASIVFDIGICVTANLFGFSLARFLINRLNLSRARQ